MNHKYYYSTPYHYTPSSLSQPLIAFFCPVCVELFLKKIILPYKCAFLSHIFQSDPLPPHPIPIPTPTIPDPPIQYLPTPPNPFQTLQSPSSNLLHYPAPSLPFFSPPTERHNQPAWAAILSILFLLSCTAQYFSLFIEFYFLIVIHRFHIRISDLVPHFYFYKSLFQVL